MKNKKMKKIILSSMSLFTFSGIILSTSMSNNVIDYSSSSNFNLFEKAIPTNLPTELKLKTTPEEGATPLAQLYPFQMAKMSSVDILKYVSFNVPTSATVTWTFDAVNNITGNLTLYAGTSAYFGSDGAIVNSATEYTLVIRGMKISGSVETSIVSSGTGVQSIYASNVRMTQDMEASNSDLVDLATLVVVSNGISSAGNDSTKIIQTRIEADNQYGTLKVFYKLENYINSLGLFIPKDDVVHEYPLVNFKSVPGPTMLEPITSKFDKSKIIPSEFIMDVNSYTDFFELINIPLGADDVPEYINVENIEIRDANDSEGTLNVVLTVTGSYYDANFLPQSSSLVPVEIVQVMDGFMKVTPGQDLVLPIVGGSIGGVVLIGGVVGGVMLGMKSKKKKDEILRKEKLSKKSSSSVPGGAPGSNNSMPGNSSSPQMNNSKTPTPPGVGPRPNTPPGVGAPPPSGRPIGTPPGGRPPIK